MEAGGEATQPDVGEALDLGQDGAMRQAEAEGQAQDVGMEPAQEEEWDQDEAAAEAQATHRQN